MSRRARLAGYSPAICRTAWGTIPMMAARVSRAACGLPGRLMTNVRSRTPATARDNAAWGCRSRLALSIAAGIPGIILCNTAAVASGVTSLGAQPVPPVVSTRLHPAAVIALIRASINAFSSGTMYLSVEKTWNASVASACASIASRMSRARSRPRTPARARDR